MSQVQHVSPGPGHIGSNPGYGRISSPTMSQGVSSRQQHSSRTSGFQSPCSQENQHFSDLQHSIANFIQGSTQVQSEIQRMSSFCSTLSLDTHPRDIPADASSHPTGDTYPESPSSRCTQVTAQLHRLGFEDVDVETCERNVLVSVLQEALTQLEISKTQKHPVLSSNQISDREYVLSMNPKVVELSAKLTEAQTQITHFQEVVFLLEKKVKWWKDQYAEKAAALEGKTGVKTQKSETLKSDTLASELRRLRNEFETNSAKLADLTKLHRKTASSNFLRRLEKMFSAFGEEEVYKAVKQAIHQGNNASSLYQSLNELSRRILGTNFKKSATLLETVKSAEFKVKELQESEKDLGFISRKLRRYCHCSHEASHAELVRTMQLRAVKQRAWFLDKVATLLHQDDGIEVEQAFESVAKMALDGRLR